MTLNFPALGRDLYDTIVASHPSLLKGKVYCKCGKSRIVDAAKCLRTGWPKCCTGTMSIDKPPAQKTEPAK